MSTDEPDQSSTRGIRGTNQHMILEDLNNILTVSVAPTARFIVAPVSMQMTFTVQIGIGPWREVTERYDTDSSSHLEVLFSI